MQDGGTRQRWDTTADWLDPSTTDTLEARGGSLWSLKARVSVGDAIPQA